MLWPSTRATWKPKVTIRVAYTAADASVFTQATNSSFQMSSVLRAGSAAMDGAAGTGGGGTGLSGATASKWNAGGVFSSPGSANATASGSPAAASSGTG